MIYTEYNKVLYGDLVKFIVEYQNHNGRNIQYNDFLFEMGNWSAEPGFNSGSNDQFSRIVNNNKKPVNAYYKYNDKIISHLCNITDKDISIFPIDTEKRNDLMTAIVERFFKNGNIDNKYKKIQKYYSNKDFENFMIATFDLAHFNSVNYFNAKRKKEHSLNEESHEITGQGEIERPNGGCDLFAEGEYLSFNDKKKNVLKLTLILAIIIVVLLFINKVVYDRNALPVAKDSKVDTTQIHTSVNDETDSDINPSVNNKKEQETIKNISVTNDKRTTQTDTGLKAIPKDMAVKQHHTKKASDMSALKKHKPAVKEKAIKSKEKSNNKTKDIKTRTNITIKGNGVVIIGDKNIVNVH